MIRAVSRSLFAVFLASSAAAGSDSFRAVNEPVFSSPYTLEARISDRRAVEEVFWRHRVWPKENRTAKPSLDAVLSADAIAAMVADALQMSVAVEALYQRPITTEQLQAELNRMSGASHDPAMLRELYGALGNDPRRIAETLARPALAENWLRNGFASDAGIHAPQRWRAEQQLAQVCAGIPAYAPEAMCADRTYLLDPEGANKESGERSDTVRLAQAEWDDFVQSFSRGETRAGGCARAKLEEESDAFSVTVADFIGASAAKVSRLTWPKRSFGDWWCDQRRTVTAVPPQGSGRLALAAPSGIGCQQKDSWRPMASNPGRLTAHTAVWTGSEMIVWGGITTDLNRNRGWRYSPATDSWTPTSMGENVPAGRFGHRAVWTGKEMLVWGGIGNEGVLNDGGRYDPRTDSWKPISQAANVPSPRSGFSMAWTGREMLVWGGRNDGVNEFDDGARYSPATDSWLPISRVAAPAARENHSTVWTGREMIVWGGSRWVDGQSEPLATGARYNPSLDAWSSIDALTAPSARSHHSAVWTGEMMIVWGGYDESGVADGGGRFLLGANRWLPVGDAGDAPTPRWAHTSVWSGQEMIVWGGTNSSTYLIGPGARYDPALDFWSEIPASAQAPSERYDATAVVTEKEMIVWGGDGSFSSNTGARLRLDTHEWIAIAGVPAPRNAYGHSNVWTGSEMIVWGGSNYINTAIFNTGARYVPALDRWQTLPDRTPALTALESHGAVWTGKEMIVWGAQLSPDGVGMRYDPSSNAWSSDFVGTNPPTGRRSFASAWTGTELLIWGGYPFAPGGSKNGKLFDPSTGNWRDMSTGGGLDNFFLRPSASATWTGRDLILWGGAEEDPVLHARYDLAQDRWSYIANDTDTSPTPRRAPVTVWTGQAMAVFGGHRANFYARDGGLYDPATDSWKRLDGIPGSNSGRKDGSMVFTGEELIIWGGLDAPGSFPRIGARYRLSTEEWTPTSLENAPAGRAGHDAVWTGIEMLVWGGGFDVRYQDGAGYCVGSPSASSFDPSAAGKPVAVQSGRVNRSFRRGGAHIPEM